MKVILLEKIVGLGEKNMIKEVAVGYARNFLIPQNKVIQATPSELAKVEKFQVELAQKAKIHKAKSDTLAKIISGITLDFSVEVSDKGHLFGSINSKDISEKLKAIHDIDVAPTEIEIEHIKKPGDYKAKVSLKGDHKAILNIKVIAKE